MRFNRFGIVVLLFLSACTQPHQARVEMKGQNNYMRSGSAKNYSSSRHASAPPSSSFDSNGYNTAYSAPVSETTEQNVSVSSIGVSDLAPPSGSAKPENKIEVKTEPEAKAGSLVVPSADKKNSDGTKTTLNPWTNKPRGDVEEKNSEVKAEAEPEIDEKAKRDLEEAIDAEKSEQGKAQEPQKKAEVKSSSAGLKWPVSGKKIISSFGAKGEGKANDGINIAAKDGDPVWAAGDGQVVYISNELKTYGNMVLIKHAGGKTTSYAHLGKITVDKYDRVKQGDVIGYVGATGNVKSPQLFFSLHKGKAVLDPQKNVSGEAAGI